MARRRGWKPHLLKGPCLGLRDSALCGVGTWGLCFVSVCFGLTGLEKLQWGFEMPCLVCPASVSLLVSFLRHYRNYSDETLGDLPTAPATDAAQILSWLLFAKENSKRNPTTTVESVSEMVATINLAARR